MGLRSEPEKLLRCGEARASRLRGLRDGARALCERPGLRALARSNITLARWWARDGRGPQAMLKQEDRSQRRDRRWALASILSVSKVFVLWTSRSSRPGPLVPRPSAISEERRVGKGCRVRWCRWR